jgi:hypothetical protein
LQYHLKGGSQLQARFHRASLHIVPGYAEPAATQEFASKYASVMPRIVSARSSLSFPVIGFGGEERGGLTTAERSSIMFSAVTKKGVNSFFIDVDAMAARGRASSPLYVYREEDRNWEGSVVSRLIEKDRIKREECIVILKIALAGVSLPDGGTSTTTIEEVPRVIRDALKAIQMQQADLVTITLPSSMDVFTTSHMQQCVKMADSLVNAGLTQYYGFGCASWSGVEGTPGYTFGQPIRPLFEAAESTATGGRQHKLIALSYEMNLGSPTPLLPLTVDARGVEWSLPQLLHSYGILSLVRNPLDAVVNGRAFRCVNTPAHLDKHPSRQLALLNDVLNYAIHCEVMWEKEVRDVVASGSNGNVQSMDPRFVVRSGDVTTGDNKASALQTEISSSDSGEEALWTGSGDHRVVRLQDLEKTDVAWARIIAGQLSKGFSLLEWRHVKQRRVKPAVERVRGACNNVDLTREWAQGYTMLMGDLMGKIDVLIEQAHSFQAQALGKELDAFLPELESSKALHVKVERILLSAPSTVLFSEAPESFSLKKNKRLRMSPQISKGDTPVPAEEEGADDMSAADNPKAPVLTVHDVMTPSLPKVIQAAQHFPRAVSAAMATPVAPFIDTLEGVPLQAELAGIQQTMRRITRSLPSSTTHNNGNGAAAS